MRDTVKAGELTIGDVVQIDPAHDDVFGGQFMIVSEPKPWGAQGYVKPLDNSGGLAYYRCPFDAMVKIGEAEWAQPEDEFYGSEPWGICHRCHRVFCVPHATVNACDGDDHPHKKLCLECQRVIAKAESEGEDG